MKVGFEWLIDAADCDAQSLRDIEKLRAVFAKVISDLDLKTIGEANWHKFPGEGGVTGLVMLTESHLACHTYPEYRTATFNLYCCRERPEWGRITNVEIGWIANLKELIGAQEVTVSMVERGSIRNDRQDSNAWWVTGGKA